MQQSRTLILACAKDLEELKPLLPESMCYLELDFGLHLRLQNLKQVLQNAIDLASNEADTILLGYRLCSMAVAGLKANNYTLVVPNVDDCIAIFLGSRNAYTMQAAKVPGTCYLTSGCIEVSDTLLDAYERMEEPYGEAKAELIMGTMLKYYTRLIDIVTGHQDQGKYQDYARMVADKFHSRYKEIVRANALVKQLLTGLWGNDIVVAEPGQIIALTDFQPSNRIASNSFGTISS